MYYCGVHAAYLPLEKFYKGSLNHGETRCKECSNKERLRRRKEDPIKTLQYKLYKSERHHGSKHAYPTIETVKAIYNHYNGCSAIDNDDKGEMYIVRRDIDISIVDDPSNGVLVTSSQARSLPRKRENRLKVFFNT
jgi:hypothetical protein